MSRAFLVPDTNVFLHYQPFNQIDWLSFVEGADAATFVVPAVVTRGLDRQKDQHRFTEMRDRARTALQRIFALVTDDPDAPRLPDGVAFRFLDDATSEAPFDFAAHGLNEQVPDDHLLAACLRLRDEADDDAFVVLVTHDVTPKIKARRRDLTVVAVPEAYRLPSTQSILEQENRRLQQTLRRHEAALPKLTLRFADGESFVKHVLREPDVMTDDVITRRMDALRAQYPKMDYAAEESADDAPSPDDAPDDTLPNLERAMRDLQRQMEPPSDQPTEDDIETYNERLAAFFEIYETYLHRHRDLSEVAGRTIRLDLVLINEGTAPAEDIDVFMHFPDGLTLREDERVTSPKPLPPSPPAQMNASLLGALDVTLPDIASDVDALLQPATPSAGNFGSSNVSSYTIHETNSYDVDFHVQRLKQHLLIMPDPLFITFPSYEDAASFEVAYRINAANLSDEATGRLSVVVEKA
jgi:hypothetical protein